jgi:hypothetical protein
LANAEAARIAVDVKSGEQPKRMSGSRKYSLAGTSFHSGRISSTAFATAGFEPAPAPHRLVIFEDELRAALFRRTIARLLCTDDCGTARRWMMR